MAQREIVHVEVVARPIYLEIVGRRPSMVRIRPAVDREKSPEAELLHRLASFWQDNSNV